MPFYVKGEKIYHYLNAFGLTPWMCLHLFYIMILYLYTWMMGHGYADAALPACGALFDHLSWVIIVSEVVMLPVFLYWFMWSCVAKPHCQDGWQQEMYLYSTAFSML